MQFGYPMTLWGRVPTMIYTAMLTSVGIFQSALLNSTFRFLVRPRAGTTVNQLILLAVAAYLLLGGVFAVAGNLLETSAPGSFVDSGAPDRPLVGQGMLYASYVTLSTLGYGEILPVSTWARSWARSLASLEAVTGTLFLAIVIARLVGAYSSDEASAAAGANRLISSPGVSLRPVGRWGTTRCCGRRSRTRRSACRSGGTVRPAVCRRRAVRPASCRNAAAGRPRSGPR